MKIIAVIVGLMVPAVALACDCAQRSATPEQAVATSEAIVEVKVVEARPASKTPELRLRVTRSWRGYPEGTELTLFPTGTDCGYRLTAGATLIIAGHLEGEHGLRAAQCDPAVNVWSGAELKQVRATLDRLVRPIK